MKLSAYAAAFISTLLSMLVFPRAASAEDMRMAVTTSFQNSGLSDILVPLIKQDVDLDVRLVVVGTGQALKLGMAGDVDAILVHSKDAEEEFVNDGHGTHRREIMYNDFILIGPENDPAAIAGAQTASQALALIAQKKALFVSRGDDSGTHRKEMALWELAKVEDLQPSWYRSVGAGMGAALNAAAGMNAYSISDRASWLNFGNKAGLKLLFSGDPVLFNQYSYLPVNPEKHPHVKYDAAVKLENWLVSHKAQAAISNYKIKGEALFISNAK